MLFVNKCKRSSIFHVCGNHQSCVSRRISLFCVWRAIYAMVSSWGRIKSELLMRRKMKCDHQYFVILSHHRYISMCHYQCWIKSSTSSMKHFPHRCTCGRPSEASKDPNVVCGCANPLCSTKTQVLIDCQSSYTSNTIWT